MKCKITRNAAKILQQELDKQEDKSLKLRVIITHQHGNHVHYGLDFDVEGENDVVVQTDKGIDLILEKGNEWMDGVVIDYFYMPQEGFAIYNPSKGNHGDH
jgi:Fe-S cluster assembly iron-binding protein IscA